MGYRTAQAASDIIIKYLLNFCLINGEHYISIAKMVILDNKNITINEIK